MTVYEHVSALVKKGALVRDANKARSLSIAEGIAVPDEDRPLRLPLVGKIAAGYPIEKVANDEELDLSEVLATQPAMLHLVCHADFDSRKLDDGATESEALFLGFEDAESTLDMLSLERLRVFHAQCDEFVHALFAF